MTDATLEGAADVDGCLLDRVSGQETEGVMTAVGIGQSSDIGVGPTVAAVQPDGIVAVARSYEDLVQACRLRRHELGLPQLVVDDLAGLASGYTGKLEVGIKRMGPMSLPCLLGALGLELVVVRIVPHHERRLRKAA